MKLREIIPLTGGRIELIDDETLNTIGTFDDRYDYRSKFDKEYGDREVVQMRAAQDLSKVHDDAAEPWFMIRLMYFDHYTTMHIYLGEEVTK